MAPRRMDICYSCRYWVGGGVRERGPKGTCHRHPPTVTDRAPAGSFPTTLSSDWCGEWQRDAGRREEEGVGDVPHGARSSTPAPAAPPTARSPARSPARPTAQAEREAGESTLYDEF